MNFSGKFIKCLFSSLKVAKRSCLFDFNDQSRMKKQYSANACQDGNTRGQGASFLSLFSFTRRKHILTLIEGLMTTIVAAMIQPVSSIFLGNLFDTLTTFGAGHISGAELLSRTSENCLILLSLGAINWALSSLYFTFWLIFGEIQAKSARDTLFMELLKKNIAWFEDQPEGIGALLVQIQAYVTYLLLLYILIENQTNQRFTKSYISASWSYTAILCSRIGSTWCGILHVMETNTCDTRSNTSLCSHNFLYFFKNTTRNQCAKERTSHIVKDIIQCFRIDPHG